MKLVCTQSDLNTNLSLAIHAVPSRPSHPILANVLLGASVEKGCVQLTGFDLSLGIRTSFPATVEVDGEVALPAKLLNDIVSKLPPGEITLALDAEEGLFTVTSNSGQFYQVRGMNAGEFPELPEIEVGSSLRLRAETFSDGLRGTLFATSSDDTKQVLTGVHLRSGTDCLEFAATDGHRLAVVEAPIDTETLDANSTGSEALAVTIPASALRELERTIAKCDKDDPIVLRFDAGQVIFELGDRCITSRRLEGSYPAYQQLIPRQFENQLNVDRRSLLSALERISVLADRKNNIVTFSLDSENQQLSLSVEAADVGNGKESMSASYSGKSLDIAFNVRYIVESLRNLQSTEVQIQLNSPTMPVILTPLGGTKMTHLVMPVQIRG
jgi:DNA polymerase III subunit beta